MQISKKDNEILGDPLIASKGWVSAQAANRLEEEIAIAVKKGVQKILLNEDATDQDLEQRVRRITGSLVNELTGRRPMIVPIVRKV